MNFVQNSVQTFGGFTQELKRAKRLVGDLMMDKELLEMRIARFEGEVPFAKRRSNP